MEKYFFSYMFNGDRDIMKVSKGVLTVMREKMTACYIYKLLVNIVIRDDILV